MKRSTKKIILYIIFAVLILCGATLLLLKTAPSFSKKTEPKQNAQLILGFSQIGSESAWRTRNTESIFEAAAQNNIQVIYDDAQQKQENQLKAIRSFIVYQVDVIAFVPIVADGWDNVLQEAKDAEIPVIIVDRKINASPDLYAGFLGENGFEEGRSAANFLVKKCKNSTKEQINIVELTGTENSSVATLRSEGFCSVIKENPKFNIIYSEDGDFLTSRGKEIMDRIITENKGLYINGKPIDVIYSHNDSMTLGLLDSFSQHNIQPNSVIIISIDAEQKIIDALTQHKVNCVVECNPNLGPTLMELVLAINQGKAIPRITYMEEKVFTESDDFAAYTPRGY